MPHNSWEIMEHNQSLGPFLTPYLKKEIEQLRTKKIVEKEPRTEAESLADLHKVIRYLFYETKIKDSNNKEKIDKLGYLNKDALNKGFEEQIKNKEFDGGPIFPEIKPFLEIFCAPKIEFIKTSHGMILVSCVKFNIVIDIKIIFVYFKWFV
jgi:hypothetical protein